MWLVFPVALVETMIEFGNFSNKLLVRRADDGADNAAQWEFDPLVISTPSVNDALHRVRD